LHYGEKMSGSVGWQRKKAESEFILGGLQAKIKGQKIVISSAPVFKGGICQ
jgi:hypothetical protein